MPALKLVLPCPNCEHLTWFSLTVDEENLSDETYAVNLKEDRDGESISMDCKECGATIVLDGRLEWRTE